MIYICEFDGTTEYQALSGAAAHLPETAGIAGIYAADDRERTEMLTRARADKALAARLAKQRERTLAWLLLEYAVRRETGYSLEQLQIARTEKGKPCSMGHPEIRFNLSHCETACACMVGREECGVDIERKFPFRESLARKVCHSQEWAALESVPGEENNPNGPGQADADLLRERQLQILWSLKESYVKRDGRGLGFGMNRVNFAGLMPFEDCGICSEQSVLWDCRETYTLAACMGPGDFESVRTLLQNGGPISGKTGVRAGESGPIYQISENVLVSPWYAGEDEKRSDERRPKK